MCGSPPAETVALLCAYKDNKTCTKVLQCEFSNVGSFMATSATHVHMLQVGGVVGDKGSLQNYLKGMQEEMPCILSNLDCFQNCRTGTCQCINTLLAFKSLASVWPACPQGKKFGMLPLVLEILLGAMICYQHS
jgi:hypothetical protein